MKMLIFLILFLPASVAIGQDISTSQLRWQVIQIEDGNSGTKRQSSDVIESVEGSNVIWKDYYGKIKRTFSILEENGAWINVQGPGSILLEISEAGSPGTIQFTRIGATLRIKFILLTGDVAEVQDFLVSQVTLL